VRDGNFPGQSESFSLVARPKQPRAPAPVAAILHAGGCGPAVFDDKPDPGPDPEPNRGGPLPGAAPARKN
jgi:hypothetical protein